MNYHRTRKGKLAYFLPSNPGCYRFSALIWKQQECPSLCAIFQANPALRVLRLWQLLSCAKKRAGLLITTQHGKEHQTIFCIEIQPATGLPR